MNFMPFPRTWRELDEGVAHFIDHMFFEGEPVGYAGDLLSGMSRFVPGSRLRMPTARLWYRNWTRELVRKEKGRMSDAPTGLHPHVRKSIVAYMTLVIIRLGTLRGAAAAGS